MWPPSPLRASLPCWRGICSRGEDDAFKQPALVARKLRRLELTAGAPHRKPGPKANPIWASDAQLRAQRHVAEQAEAGYRRLVADWRASRPKVSAGATPERASQRPSKGKAARQAASS
jgi:hypothetical protein